MKSDDQLRCSGDMICTPSDYSPGKPGVSSAFLSSAATVSCMLLPTYLLLPGALGDFSHFGGENQGKTLFS
ncbi:homeobox protein Hox-A6 [Platysternon megacephalum]|uniref:Homeobox protein Hox-A6 n=1 Tax=Platysternon megacephalum TaxID=55544 RepID=A0A4D9EQ16_9SAUR|nr:homeobox protein Hox-A6 [Platysternon megacephalum]